MIYEKLTCLSDFYKLITDRHVFNILEIMCIVQHHAQDKKTCVPFSFFYCKAFWIKTARRRIKALSIRVIFDWCLTQV